MAGPPLRVPDNATKGETMTVYSGPVFEMAANQFNVIANHLDIPMDERDRLLMPKRAITVSCPIHRDDGTVAVFEGYRVQHLLTMGPTKGGTRFAPSVDIGEVAALAIWMSWKCELAGRRYGRDPGLWQCRLLYGVRLASIWVEGDRGQRSYRRAL